ncbi:MAG: DUF3052 domain-containing protein [Bacillota bacterium]|nr:DUF3052 domain-containing protein [Bacillota bacterium]
MNAILKKLGLKDQNPILILNAPAEYQPVMNDVEAELHTEIKGRYKFIQVFAAEMFEAQKYVEEVLKVLEEDGHIWLCYPKGTSKKYKSDITRNKSWELFSPYDFEPVSQVAIDEDWSAMRFRPVDSIKTMTRKTAATEKGRERIKE